MRELHPRRGVVPARAVVLIAAALLAGAAFADEAGPATGGRGLVTFEGPTGLFINPSSGTLPRGRLTPQYCILLFEQRDTTVVWHQGMVAYGVTDWLEVGALGVIEHFESDHSRVAGGPLLRVRLLREEAWWPEASVGGILREGDERLTRRTLFAALSRRIPVAEHGVLRAVRLHAGARQYWQDPDVNRGSATLGYVGVELELPRGVFLVGEVSTKNDPVQDVPFAVGVQIRRPDGFGFSLAVMQTGTQDGVGAYVGIGISFQ